MSLSSVNRNKLLILSPEDSQLCDDVVKYLFGDVTDTTNSIIRNKVWETKYYSVSLDIYLGDFVSLKNWCDEFMADECAELRDALAGIVLLVDDLSNLELFAAMVDSAKFKDGKLLVVCNIGSDTLTEDDVERQNANMLGTGITFLNWHNEGKNSFGEAIGRSQLKELFDVHQWDTHDFQLKKVSSSDTADQSKFDPASMGNIVTQLKQARERYLEITDAKDAEEYANGLAWDITEKLVGNE
ncbi:HHL094Wp [Eremothecium sinecaudum]|uniref:Increased recombination centers protein 6 n=1 Tax=Eremothecium sinecaudum TaxID=45286 RepID=A0A0X8HVV1_9SACH|nr:HHL094Wp [Eremothecium sinecaudum]AMD22676.1 HHL094Wp [Eremothecium sinecaudum]